MEPDIDCTVVHPAAYEDVAEIFKSCIVLRLDIRLRYCASSSSWVKIFRHLTLEDNDLCAFFRHCVCQTFRALDIAGIATNSGISCLSEAFLGPDWLGRSVRGVLG